MDFRWDADYRLKYDEGAATEALIVATDFNSKIRELIGK
jgi:hypothetical protein